MIINSTITQLHHSLEQEGVVGAHTSASFYGLSYSRVKKCCSITNSDFLSRFVYRLLSLCSTGKWMNDEAIGIGLFYECLWLNSAIADDIQQKQHDNMLLYAEQAKLLGKTLKKILYSYQKPESSVPFVPYPIENAANPALAKMFPIATSSAVGVSVAKDLKERAQSLKMIARQENPYRFCTTAFDVDQRPYNMVHKRGKADTTIEGGCWSQSIYHPLSFLSLTHTATCTRTFSKNFKPANDENEQEQTHTMSAQRETWWSNKTEEQKMHFLFSQKLHLQEVNRAYSPL